MENGPQHSGEMYVEAKGCLVCKENFVHVSV